jgi:hypothetical protein
MKTSFGSAALVGLALSSAMAFYAVSLHVAAERSGIEKVRAQIVADSHDIRMLQAELRTRARLPELQRWNEQVLALAPPKPGQFIDSPLVLANYAAPAAAMAPAVRFAAAHVAHATTAAASPVQQVTYRQPQTEDSRPRVGIQAMPANKSMTSAPIKVASSDAAATHPAHRMRNPIIAAAELATPSSIGLDATLGGQLAAAAAQEHVTRASYTLR